MYEREYKFVCKGCDRIVERTRLTAQQKQLQLSLDRLKAASITPPATPQAVPTVMALPPVSYLEHEAAVEKTKAAIAEPDGIIEQVIFPVVSPQTLKDLVAEYKASGAAYRRRVHNLMLFL
jgi:hypothetical protein